MLELSRPLLYRKDFEYQAGKGMVHKPTGTGYACKGVNKVLTEGLPKIEYNKARTQAGIAMHDSIDKAIANNALSDLPMLQSYLSKHASTDWHSEVFVHLQGNKRDCIGFIDAVGFCESTGAVLVLDWKQKLNSRFNRTTMLKNALQVSAYSYMFAKMYGIDKPERLSPCIVYLFESGEPYEEQIVTKAQMFSCIHTFLSKLG